MGRGGGYWGFSGGIQCLTWQQVSHIISITVFYCCRKQNSPLFLFLFELYFSPEEGLHSFNTRCISINRHHSILWLLFSAALEQSAHCSGTGDSFSVEWIFGMVWWCLSWRIHSWVFRFHTWIWSISVLGGWSGSANRTTYNNKCRLPLHQWTHWIQQWRTTLLTAFELLRQPSAPAERLCHISVMQNKHARECRWPYTCRSALF